MTLETGDILDDLFHACALAAFLEQAARELGWPDVEATRRRAYQIYEECLAVKNGETASSRSHHQSLETENQPGRPQGGRPQPERTHVMKVYDNYEISPCKRYEEPVSPGKFYFEVCEPDEADVWTLFGHIDGEGVEAIGDFDSREHAEEVYSRITGQAFPASYQSRDWLRVMYAGQKLLHALTELLRQIDEDIPTDSTKKHFASAVDDALVAIADATGRAA
jgi:hypothetical protein